MSVSDAENNDSPSRENEGEEDIMDLVKGEGPWQRWIFLLIMMIAVTDAYHNLAMSFFAPNLDHWCERPFGSNMSVEHWKEVALPPNDQQCSRYKFINFSQIEDGQFHNESIKRETVSCDSWEYEDSIYISTVLAKWNLVCSREWLISMSKSIFIAGFFLQATLFGYFSDKFGRKPVIVICNAITVVSAIICAFSNSFLMFAVARFFIAVGVTGADSTGFILLMEITGPKFRSLYGIGACVAWTLGYVTLPCIAWWLRDWFLIQIVITSPSILLLFCFWFLPESPRWLLAQGKNNAAFQILSKAGKINGLNPAITEPKLKDMISKESKANENENTNANVLQLFKPGLRQKTCIMCYLWAVIAFMYYGITYNTNELAGDPFINFAVYGLVEIPANVISLVFMQTKGRRNPLAISLAAAGASCLLMYLIPDDPWWLGAIFSLFGKFSISCAFSIVYVFTAEIFPTVVRNMGLGSASVSARVGAILAPFVRELGKATHPIVPQIIFGILAGAGGFLVLFLPETNQRKIPDTIREAADISR